MSRDAFDSAENKPTRQRYILERAIRVHRMPDAELYSRAQELWRRKSGSCCYHYGARPVVRVFKLGGQRTIVLRAGNYYVSACSWRRLAEKVVLDRWHHFLSGGLYYRRWK